MWIFSTSYQQTHTSPIIRTLRKPRKPPDPIEVINDVQIPELIKLKLNIGTVTYDIYPTI